MAICGPKLSLCGLILSVWGVIQLAFMGLFYYINAVALAEDIPEIDIKSRDDFYNKAETAYSQNAFNCWIAACLYLATLAFSGHQFWLNSRSSLSI